MVVTGIKYDQINQLKLKIKNNITLAQNKLTNIESLLNTNEYTKIYPTISETESIIKNIERILDNLITVSEQ